MQKTKSFAFMACLAAVIFASASSLRAQLTLGDAPRAPKDVSGLPGRGPRPLDVNGGFSVDAGSREQVRDFFNAVYTSSDNTPIDSTADQADCMPGTNSPAFAEVTLRRINWFRAMAGIPAAVTFDSSESAKDQQAAVIMSSNGKLQHVGDWTGWSCVTANGTNAAGSSNLALGSDGPDAITGYIWDYGANNYEVGHRRWILYPQTQVMGTGDVPLQTTPTETNLAANATWVFDANYGGPRPATRTPYVAWPPAGYVPYQVVFPQWSFALSNANLSASTVSMKSNGVPVAVTIQPYATGYGENTLVWYPNSLNPADSTVEFPFGGTDTVYSITVSNVMIGAHATNFSYNVTVFDPAVPGADYFPPTISGPSQPSVGANNAYTFTGITNATSYQWLVAQSTNGDLTDKAQNGLANFTISPAPNYPVITNAPDGSGKCFHLTHTNSAPQLLQLKELLLPATNTMLNFKSLLGYATATETARVQVSSDGGANWSDLFTEPGSNGPGESTFTAHSLSLSNYAGTPILLRFNYDYENYTSYYYETDPYVGWCLENTMVTNAQQLVNLVTNSTASTNFTFTPAQTGNYDLQARALIFTQFPLGWGPVKSVTAVIGAPVITLSAPVVSGGQVQINFTVSGSASIFKLLQADQLGGAWSTNTSAVFTTNTPGSSYRFTTSAGAAMRFYRVQTP
jgi:Cysteine-rich secretory protein family